MRRAPLVLLAVGALVGGALFGTPAQASPASPAAPKPPKASATGKPDFDLREGGTTAERKQLRLRGAKLQARGSSSRWSATSGGRASSTSIR